jgi:predicted transposase YbfD/YdcC
MSSPPARISEADWLVTPANVRTLILSQQEEIDQLRQQLTALATELASLRTTPEALLQMVRERWSIEGWHWIRDTQLQEAASCSLGRLRLPCLVVAAP